MGSRYLNAIICTPRRRDDLPAYARTGQLHSGDPEAEIASRCTDLLHALHGADHQEHENLNSFLERTGHPANTGNLTPGQLNRIEAVFRRHSQLGERETADRAELLLNAAGMTP